MGVRYTRLEVLDKIRKTINEGNPVIVASAGCGIVAKFLERSGIDIIGVYNSAKYRMMGLPSTLGRLPVGDANSMVLELGKKEILPIVKETPVIAGVNANDPTKDMKSFLNELSRVGFSGVHNYPTVGLWTGSYRQLLEDLGLGYDNEIRMIQLAHKLGLFTMGYVFDKEDVYKMCEAGADVICCHVGTTVGGTTGAKKAISLPEAAKKSQEIAEAAKEINPDAIVLAHGGPIVSPEDTLYIYKNAPDIVGFVAGSSIERLAIENAITEYARRFKEVKIKCKPKEGN